MGFIFIVTVISRFCLSREKSNCVTFPLSTEVFGFAIEYHIGKDKKICNYVFYRHFYGAIFIAYGYSNNSRVGAWKYSYQNSHY